MVGVDTNANAPVASAPVRQPVAVARHLFLSVSPGGTGSGSFTCNGQPCQGDVAFPYGTTVRVVPNPTSGSTFDGWSGSCTGRGECVVPLDTNRVVSATFNLTPRTLTIAPPIGTGTGGVRCSVGGAPLGECQASYPHGTTVTLTAVPDPATSSFVGWEASPPACSTAGAGPCQLLMDRERTVRATFALQQRPFTVSPNVGDGTGTISCTVRGVTGRCAPAYDHDTQVTVTADANDDSVLTGWSGACQTMGTGVGTDTGTCTVTIGALPVDLGATFTLRRFSVTANVGSGSGQVAVACGVPAVPCDATRIPYGTRVTVTATPAAGFLPVGFGVAPSCVPQSLTECTFASLTRDASVLAYFSAP
jgi:hypothetical protein